MLNCWAFSRMEEVVSSVVFLSLLYDEMKFRTHLGREMAKWAIVASWMWPQPQWGQKCYLLLGVVVLLCYHSPVDLQE